MLHIPWRLLKKILRMRRRLIRIGVPQGDLLMFIEHLGLYCSTKKYVHGERIKHIGLYIHFKKDIIAVGVIIMKCAETLYKGHINLIKQRQKESSKYPKSY